MVRSTSTHIGIVAGTLLMAGGAIAAAILDAAKLDIYSVATTLIGAEIIIGCVIAQSFKRASRPSSLAFDEGLQMGYDNGWNDCRRSVRPVVVPIRQGAAL